VKERISAVGSSAPRITITNRGGWVGVDAAERQFVEAEIVATQDEFIAVFETQPGVDDAPLGILCGPVRILPKSVLKVVAMRTTTAAGIIAGKKKLFKGRMKPVYFAEARCDRNVCVAVAGPLGGSTMTKGMVDVLCSPRVRFAQAWTTATGEKQAYEFFLDDTVHPAEHNFDARPTCYDTNSVFAFDTERKPTPDVRRMLALGFVQAALGGSATTATKWLVDQRSVRTLWGTRTAIVALTAPPQHTGHLLRDSSGSYTVCIAPRQARRMTQPRSNCVLGSTACSRRTSCPRGAAVALSKTGQHRCVRTTETCWPEESWDVVCAQESHLVNAQRVARAKTVDQNRGAIVAIDK
jgi:hypothetical protein